MNQTGFEFEVWDGGRLKVNRRFAGMLRAAGLTTFDALFELSGGDVVRAIGGRSTARVRLAVEDGATAFFLKRHRPAGLFERLRPLINFSWPILGARNEWDGILLFHSAGIPTMTPVAFGESGGRSLVMTQELPADRTLLDWVNAAAGGNSRNPSQPTGDVLPLKRALTSRVAEIARRMHESGLHHQDFYLNHVLCCGDPQALDLRLIDLGRARRTARLSRRWIVKDLAQLDFSARRLSCADRLRFLRLYLGRPFVPSDRELVRRIARKSRRIAAHTAKNGL